MCRCFVISALLTLAGLVALIIGLIMAFAVFDILIDDEVRERVRLKNETEQFERWKESEEPVTLNFYFFHITNADAVTTEGARPVVSEVGPFVYNMHHRRHDVQFLSDGNLLHYNADRYLVFDSLASLPQTEEQEITILNVPLQSAQQLIEMNNDDLVIFNRDWREAFGFSVNAAPAPFQNVRVRDILFDGIPFCTNLLEQQLCSSIRATVANSRTLREENNQILFSFFPSRNPNDRNFLISTGIDNDDVGNINAWNGETSLNVWHQQSCNLIRGTDGTIFFPFNDQNSSVEVFYHDVCRRFNLEFDDKEEVKEVDGYRYAIKDNVFSDTTPDRTCYCINITKNLDGENVCLPNGFEDMHNCYGSHLVLSLPHLLWADSEYQATVVGLSPNESEHDSFVNLEPTLGTPLATARRFQFNMLVRNNSDVTIGVTPGVIPIFWFEEITKINEELVDAVVHDFLDWTFTLFIIQWVLIAIGGAITLVSFITCLCCRN